MTVLSLHDRKHTSLDQTLVSIDRDQTVREILWKYARGGHVRLTIVPTQIGGYALPQTEEAEIVMSTYRAMAVATFSNYRINALIAASPSPPPIDAGSGQPHRRAQKAIVQRRGK